VFHLEIPQMSGSAKIACLGMVLAIASMHPATACDAPGFHVASLGREGAPKQAGALNSEGLSGEQRRLLPAIPAPGSARTPTCLALNPRGHPGKALLAARQLRLSALGDNLRVLP
jgi:hypothetical protein